MLRKARAIPIAALLVCAMPTQGSTQSTVDGAWHLGRDRGEQELIFAGSLISGHTGCRPFSGEVTGQLQRGRVRIGPLAGSCTRAQKVVETAFLTKLRSVQSFALRNGRLEGRNAAGVLQFSATRSSPQPTSSPSTFPNGTWYQEGAAARSTTTRARPPSVSILGQQLRVTGYCNSFSGTIAFGPRVSGRGTLAVFVSNNTNVMCAVESEERADQALINALTSATSYSLASGRLTLLNAENTITKVLTQE